jgi:acetate kinase
MSLLTINAGSSSLKVALYDDEAASCKATIAVEQIGGPEALLRIGDSNRSTTRNVELHDHAAAINEVFNGLPEPFGSTIRAIGHRLVHGGPDHQDPERITPSLLHALKKLEGYRSLPVSTPHSTDQCQTLHNVIRFRDGH